MGRLLYAGAVSLFVFGSPGYAVAQNTPSPARRDLTSQQRQMVSRELTTAPSQPAPAGVQPRVGSKLPDSMTAQSLPSNVTDQIPEARQLLFVKLPDRVVLIDPDTQVVTEIVAEPTTTGSASDDSVPPSRCTAGASRLC